MGKHGFYFNKGGNKHSDPNSNHFAARAECIYIIIKVLQNDPIKQELNGIYSVCIFLNRNLSRIT